MSRLFVIKFDNGSYNLGAGDMNGHEAIRKEATQYTEEEVLERLPELCGVVAVEAVNAEDAEAALSGSKLTLAIEKN
jgi:hypothetical protein